MQSNGQVSRQARQQGYIEGEGEPNESLIKIWWDRYIHDVDFRLSQEIEAYHEQYEFLCRTYRDPNIRRKILYALAKTLASPMYGDKIDQDQAVAAIEKGVDNSA